jgi:hypothetical protein
MKSTRILITYSFIVCIFLMTIGLFSAKTSSQLLNSFIYLPLIFYFGIKLLQTKRRPQHKKHDVKQETSKKISQIQTISDESPITPEVVVGVPDNDKRLFLKLIGSAGFSLLLMALFTKKAQASFFGSAPVGPGIVGIKDISGNKINPSEKKPTDGYEVSNIDDAATPSYYGFIDKSGAWYILQNDAGTFLYAKGSDTYTLNWTNRTTLIYDYFNNVFS